MELKKTKNGTHYIDNVKFMDLIRITGNSFPICDCCSEEIDIIEDEEDEEDV